MDLNASNIEDIPGAAVAQDNSVAEAGNVFEPVTQVLEVAPVVSLSGHEPKPQAPQAVPTAS